MWKPSNKQAFDEELAEKFWEKTEELLDIIEKEGKLAEEPVEAAPKGRGRHARRQ